MGPISWKGAIAATLVGLLLFIDLSQFDNFFFPFKELWWRHDYLTLAFSTVLFVWCLLSAVLILLADRSLVRTLTLPLFLFFFLFNVGSFTTSGAPMDFHQAVTIVNNFQWWFWEVVENYGISVLPLILVLVPTIIFLDWLPKFAGLRISRWAYVMPVSAVLLTSLGLTLSQGLFDRYPSFFRVPSMFFFASQSRLLKTHRSPVEYSKPLGPGVEKIILVVDESIRADLLGINSAARDTTPNLRSKDRFMVNYGLAASASNCSDYSNLILRTGVRKRQIPDVDQATLKNPSVWQFAKTAGYHTVYLDAQSASDWKNYQNFMDEQETVFIDDLLRLRQEHPYESDTAALRELVDHLEQPGRVFLMLNKYGLHFPYFRSYPKESETFTPVLAPYEPMENRERAMNSYMNGIIWSVDRWFEALLAGSEAFRRFILIYTSDHGQNIVDDGTLATHCRPAANRFEGIVPMLILSNDPGLLRRFQAAQADNLDRSSHFQVFPTLLELAGYERGWVRSRYGHSLADRPLSAPEFFVGDIYGRGSVRRWLSIHPARREGDPSGSAARKHPILASERLVPTRTKKRRP